MSTQAWFSSCGVPQPDFTEVVEVMVSLWSMISRLVWDGMGLQLGFDGLRPVTRHHARRVYGLKRQEFGGQNPSKSTIPHFWGDRYPLASYILLIFVN